MVRLYIQLEFIYPLFSEKINNTMLMISSKLTAKEGKLIIKKLF